MNLIRHVVEIGEYKEIVNYPFTDIISIRYTSGDNCLSLEFRHGAIQERIILEYKNTKVIKSLERDLINYYTHLSYNNEILGFESSDKIFEIRDVRKEIIDEESPFDETISYQETIDLSWEIKTSL